MSNPLNPTNLTPRQEASASTTWPPSPAAAARLLTVDDAGHIEESTGVSLIASAWRRLRRNPVFLLGAGITALFILLAIFAPLIAPHDPASRTAPRQGAAPDQPGPRARGRLPPGRRHLGS